ncbi:Hcp family type VI secretion system effector [Paenibacillus sp. GCM10027628]|uniref:Hcp family type VI secretion system effector n=1 Tax=Paenibacillus sp. GCM10027628 TaxID=3273413 RepID=UPI00363073EE
MRTLKKQFFIMAIVLLLALTFSIVPASAASTSEPQPKYDVYLNLDGIPGDSTVKNYEKWIQLADVQFDVSSKASAVAGSGAGAGKAALENFTITKPFDSASIPLFVDMATGKNIAKGQLVFVSNALQPAAILTIDLSTVFISDYKFDDTHETISLRFGGIKMSYTPITAKGTKGTPITGGWDFIKNTKQ